MCVVNDAIHPRRRHRPAYLAPSRTFPWGDTTTTGTTDIHTPGRTLATLAIPMMDPSFEQQQQQQSSSLTPKTITSILKSILRGVLDLFLLLFMAIVGLFLYDVEIKLVPVNNQQQQQQHYQQGHVRGSRVEIRHDVPAPYSSNSGLLPTRRGILVADSIV